MPFEQLRLYSSSHQQVEVVVFIDTVARSTDWQQSLKCNDLVTVRFHKSEELDDSIFPLSARAGVFR